MTAPSANTRLQSIRKRLSIHLRRERAQPTHHYSLRSRSGERPPSPFHLAQPSTSHKTIFTSADLPLSKYKQKASTDTAPINLAAPDNSSLDSSTPSASDIASAPPDLHSTESPSTSIDTAESLSSEDTSFQLPFADISNTELQLYLSGEPSPPIMATAADIRLIIKETLGTLGPALDQQGVVQAGAAQPTLLDRIKNMKKKTEVSKPPGPFVFSGSHDDNPAEWKSRMQDYLDHAGYATDAEKLRIARMHLKNRASIWYKNLDANDKNTYAAFLTAFDRKFLQGESKYSAQQALYACKQLPTETPETYIDDVLTKADMLEWPQDQTKQHLIGGLHESLKPYVIMANPQTLEETCDVIMRSYNANKASIMNQGLPGIQNALAEILTQVKADKEPKKITALSPDDSPSPRPPSTNYRRSRPMINRTAAPPPPQPPIIINTMQPMQRPRPRFNRQGAGRPMAPFQQPTPRLRQPDFNNPCFLCGSTKHWKDSCPYITTATNTVPYRPPYRPNFQRRQGPNPNFRFQQPRPILNRQEN